MSRVAKHGSGYPKQAPFASVRVDGGNRSTDTYYDDAMPDDIAKLHRVVDGLAPAFKRIVALEYVDKRPQKTLAKMLGIPRQVFSQRLNFIHEQLEFAMFGILS